MFRLNSHRGQSGDREWWTQLDKYGKEWRSELAKQVAAIPPYQPRHHLRLVTAASLFDAFRNKTLTT